MADLKTDIGGSLTQDESYVASRVADVARRRAPGVTPRLAGGWVRDKLLGLPSYDYDIMLDKMSGDMFARLFCDELGVSEPHTIRANPERSKHIETAKVRLMLPSGSEVEIDFAMARREWYAEDSRIPSAIEPGTPQDDASRRDFSVNALFYNLFTGEVEDLTGHGLDDLRSGTIRAPGVPVDRFNDDPLRVLRALRFVGRFGWGIEPETLKAMGDPTVLEALMRKTSRERVGAEFAKTLNEQHADKAIELMRSTGVMQSVLQEALKGTEYEGKMADWSMGQDSPYHELNLWDHTMATFRGVMSSYPVGGEGDRRLVMLTAALFHDLGKMFDGARQVGSKGHTTYYGHDEHSQKMSEHILRALKLHPIAKQVGSVVGLHMRPHRLTDKAKDKSVRRLLRDIAGAGAEWVDVINLAYADATAKGGEDSGYAMSVARVNRLKEAIERILSELHDKDDIVRPILDGNEIMTLFKRRDSGPWIRDVMNWLLDMRDANPQISKDEAKRLAVDQFPEHVKTEKTAAKESEILMDVRREQIERLVSSRPREAVSIATDVMEDNPDDHDSIAMCVGAVLMAASRGGANLMSQAIYEASLRLLKLNHMSPAAMALNVSSKVLFGKPLNDDDCASLVRALRMDAAVAKGIVDETKKIAGGEDAALLDACVAAASEDDRK